LGFGVHSLVAFVINFVFVLLMYRLKINKESKNLMFLSILLGSIILQIGIRVIDFKGTLISLPDFILSNLGFVAAYIFLSVKSKLKFILPVTGFLLVLFFLIKGYDMWLHYYNF